MLHAYIQKFNVTATTQTFLSTKRSLNLQPRAAADSDAAAGEASGRNHGRHHESRGSARGHQLRGRRISRPDGRRTDIYLLFLFARSIDRGQASDAALRSNTRGGRSRSESSRSQGVDILASTASPVACPRWNSTVAAGRHVMCPPRPQ